MRCEVGGIYVVLEVVVWCEDGEVGQIANVKRPLRLGIVCCVDQDRVGQEHQPGNQQNENPVWFVNDVRDQLDARDDHEGWESDAIEDSENSKESKDSASTNLHMLSVVSNAIDEDQTPKYDERFDTVGECVRLVGPCNVGGRHQRDGDSSVS